MKPWIMEGYHFLWKNFYGNIYIRRSYNQTTLGFHNLLHLKFGINNIKTPNNLKYLLVMSDKT